jgi:hypothetical protein
MKKDVIFVKIYPTFHVRYMYTGHSYCISDLSSPAKWAAIALVGIATRYGLDGLGIDCRWV